MPAAPAISRTEPIDQAVPIQSVCTGARMYCMVSYMANPLVTTPPES